jgi:hypothetical protein
LKGAKPFGWNNKLKTKNMILTTLTYYSFGYKYTETFTKEQTIEFLKSCGVDASKMNDNELVEMLKEFSNLL